MPQSIKHFTSGSLIQKHLQKNLDDIEKRHKHFFDTTDVSKYFSVDIDKLYQRKFPNANRWDYLICSSFSKQNEAFIFAEIHSANTTEISTVLAKLSWLQEIIKDQIAISKNLKLHFIWIPSSNFRIRKDTPQYKKLATSKIKILSKVEIKKI